MKRFYRRSKSKVFAGVASGIADYLNLDPIWIRLAFVVGTFVGGSTILIYLILMFVLPKDYEVMNYSNINVDNSNNPTNQNNSFSENIAAENINYNPNNYSNYNPNYNYGNDNIEEKNQTQFKIFAGVILILAGVLFFVGQIIPDFDFSIMFSILLIVTGIFVLFSNKIKANF